MIKINKIRKGKTFQAYWPITTNGSIVPLLGRDLTLYIIDPTELYKEISFTVENTNKLLFTYEGTEQKLCGIYRILLVENKNQKNQSLVDSLAFELVPKSEDEYIYNSNSIIDNIRIINLNVSDLGIVSNKEDSPSTPSTPTNPNYQSGGKEVSGFKEVEVSKESGATNIYKLMYTDGTFSTIKATNGKDGVSPKISIGQVETLELGQQAYVENVGTDTNVILNIGIPKGTEGEAIDSEARNDISRITNILGSTYNPEDPSGESDKSLPVKIEPTLSLGVEVAKVTDSLGNILYIKVPFYTELNITGLASFSNIEALKNASGLKAGDTVMTKGYYSANDGGGSFFTILSSTSDTAKNYAGKSWKQAKSGETVPYVDDATLIELADGMYANLLVPANRKINFLQMGAKKYSIIHSTNPKSISQPDNKPYMLKWLAFLDRKKTTYDLYISDGVYSFSETWLVRKDGNFSCMGVRIYGECSQSSGGESAIIIPHYKSLQYIFRVGYYDYDDPKQKSVAMRQVVLLDLNFGTTRYAWTGNSLAAKNMSISSEFLLTSDSGTTGNNFLRYVTKGALVLENCPYGQFDGLYFLCISGTALYLILCYESHFGYTNIRGCKRITSTGYTYPMVYINAPGPSSVSACYFYYFNFEGCYGDFFYSKTLNFTHNEFNNLLMECSVSVAPSYDIRYTKDGNTPIALDNATTGLNKSPLYSSSLSLPTTLTTYKARAFSGTTAVSKTSTVIYDPNAVVKPPAIKIHRDGIRMYCATEGASIYYTIDGTEPTSASTLYTGRIDSPDINVTFRAKAILGTDESTVSVTPYVTGLEVQAPSIRVGESTIVMRVVDKGTSIYADIDKMSDSLKYDTDPGYVAPTEFKEDGETVAVFGKWVKWFVFTGNMGSAPNYINSISASNFGNGFKKYRTYSLSDGNVVDSQGNIIPSDHYILDNGMYYALNDQGYKIIDYYRHYALFGEDENNPRDLQTVSGVTKFGSFVWNINSIYMFRYESLSKYYGPWVVYLRINPLGFNLNINQIFDKSEYPYYFLGIFKGSITKESTSIPGAIPFFDLLQNNNGAQAMVYTRSGTCSPNGLCVKYSNAFSFVAIPGKQYGFRAYCPTSVYNTLLLYNLSEGKPFIKWKGLLCTESSDNPYTGNATSIVNNSGWVYITLPDLQLTKPTAVYFGASGLFDTCSRNFIVGLSLDVLIS